MTGEGERPLVRLALGMGIAVGTILLARLAGFDVDAARAVLADAGIGLVLSVLPFSLLLVIEAVAWGMALDVAPSARMLARLVGARLGIEAVSLTAPGSILASDGVAPLLFSRSAQVPAATAEGGAAERLRRVAARIPSAWVRKRADALVGAAAETDAHASVFFGGDRRRVVGLVLVSSLVWVAEALEVFVLLRVLGASPSFTSVLALEALLSVARSAAFFSPGGLGAQELAYLTLLPPLLGAESQQVASAFVVLRRCRDLLTIALGYGTVARRAVFGEGRPVDGPDE